MRVRVFDKVNNTYFVSEVYAIVNLGIYAKYLVVQKVNSERFFKFFHYKNINLISSNQSTEPWVTVREEYLVYFMPIIPTADRNKFIHYYRGFEFIYEQKNYSILYLKAKKVL